MNSQRKTARKSTEMKEVSQRQAMNQLTRSSQQQRSSQQRPSSPQQRQSSPQRRSSQQRSSQQRSSQRKLIKIAPNDHVLSQHGYHNIKELNEEQRHVILDKLVKELSKGRNSQDVYREIIQKLVGRSSLLKKTNPRTSSRMKANQEYLSQKMRNERTSRRRSSVKSTPK
jgi:hypothetical protein